VSNGNGGGTRRPGKAAASLKVAPKLNQPLYAHFTCQIQRARPISPPRVHAPCKKQASIQLQRYACPAVMGRLSQTFTALIGGRRNAAVTTGGSRPCLVCCGAGVQRQQCVARRKKCTLQSPPTEPPIAVPSFTQQQASNGTSRVQLTRGGLAPLPRCRPPKQQRRRLVCLALQSPDNLQPSPVHENDRAIQSLLESGIRGSMACVFALPLHLDLMSSWHMDAHAVALGLQVRLVFEWQVGSSGFLNRDAAITSNPNQLNHTPSLSPTATKPTE